MVTLASPLVELAFLITAVLIVDYQFFGNTRFWNAQADPFLLPVLLLSAQYGAGFGVVAVIASSVALLTGPLPPLTFSQDLYSYTILLAYRPALWMIAAVVLGSISGQHLRRARRSSKVLAETEEQRSVIAMAYSDAQRANDALVLRLNSERVTLSQVSDAIQRLMRRSIEEIVNEVDELMALTVGARKFSIFLARASCLEAMRSQGWKTDDEFARVYAKDLPIFRAIAEQRRLLCIANPLDESFLVRDGVLAGPICDPNTGEVLGMLKIEELDFIRFGAEAIDNFRVAAEWLGFALAGADAFKTPRFDGRLQDRSGETTALTADDAHGDPRRSPPELQFVISVVSIRLHPRGGSELDVATVREAVRQAVRATLRADQLIEPGEIGAEFFLFLPGTSAEIARLYATTLESALRQYLPSALQNTVIEISERALCLAGKPHPISSLIAQRAA